MQIYQKNQKTGFESGLVEWLTENSALILIIGAVASFLITAIIEFSYYRTLFSESLSFEIGTALSAMLAIFFQGIRCASLASTAKLFSLGQSLRGGFILVVSLAVTVFCAYEAGQVAQIWESGRPEITGHVKLVLLALVWSGWMLELILIVNLSGRKKAGDQAAAASGSNRPAQQAAAAAGSYQSSNGHSNGGGGNF